MRGEEEKEEGWGFVEGFTARSDLQMTCPVSAARLLFQLRIAQIWSGAREIEKRPFAGMMAGKQVGGRRGSPFFSVPALSGDEHARAAEAKRREKSRSESNHGTFTAPKGTGVAAPQPVVAAACAADAGADLGSAPTPGSWAVLQKALAGASSYRRPFIRQRCIRFLSS